MPDAVDTVLVGNGHHELIATALLVLAGWDGVVVEAQPIIGLPLWRCRHR